MPLTYNVTDSTPVQSRYNFSYSVFPEDLGSEYYGHYMVININVPTNSSGQGRGASDLQMSPILSNDFSTVDILRFGPGGVGINPWIPGVTAGNAQGEALSIGRGTRRIEAAIAIYIPDPMAFQHTNIYEDVKLTNIAGGAIGGAAGAAIGGLIGGPLGAAAGASLGGNLGGNVTGGPVGTIAQLGGKPINPRVEVLFATTSLREFQFDFLMAPASENESVAMKNIIDILRYYSHPELDPATAGLTFIPPADFDIQFYNKGKENTAIPRINTCVLTNMDVIYAPQGPWSTFHNGYPVMCQMVLKFRETEMLHKRRIKEGY
jgi:hypothetical protein